VVVALPVTLVGDAVFCASNVAAARMASAQDSEKI